MEHRRLRTVVRLAATWTVVALVMPAAARAQGGGTISGLVTDTTGGILPGVTVEAASPALIEGMITAITDGAGRYTIINLRPGDYTVTFTLPGFGTVIREGLVLEGEATLQVNAELQVGALEETVTVSGAAPLVDVQQVRRQSVVTQEMMDTLPTARTREARALLVPGVRNTGLSEGQYWPTVHGSEAGDAVSFNDGMRANSIIDDANYTIGWEMNDAGTAEITFETGGAPAEVQVGGMVMNAIPKEGGNTFSGTSFTYFGHENFQGDNLSAELREQISVANRLAYSIDFNPAFGGPIAEDKLWFFTSTRLKDDKNFVADQFFKPAGTIDPISGEDLSFGKGGEQAYNRGYDINGLLRLTHQINPQHKWRISFERNNTYSEFADVTSSRPPESANFIPQPVGYHTQARYTASLSSRVLIEAGYATQYNRWRRHELPVVEGQPSTFDLATGQWGGGYVVRGWQREQRHHARGSFSYVTGSHNFKAGVDQSWGNLDLGTRYNGDIRTLYFINGAPIGLDVLAAPVGDFGGEINWDLGFYAQDSWTLGRTTLNLGIRNDFYRAQIPEQSAPAGTWVPERSFPAFPGPSWNDVSVRLGVAYDLFGDGRWALKGNLNQFVAGEGTRLTMLRNPMASQTWAPNAEFRSWSDLDANGLPFTADGAVQFDEVGPSPNENFGLLADTTALDPDLAREAHWEYSVSLQHELLPGLSLTGGIYRRDYYNLQWTDNLATTHEDYTPFAITGPVDSRLPGGGGEAITLYNLNQNVFGLSDLIVRNSDIRERVYTGFEFIADARFPNGAFAGGSVTRERTRSYTCDDVDDPNSLRFCDYVDPFRTMFKAHGAYPLPAGIMLSGFLQGYPGPDYDATYTVNSEIAGIPITGGDTIEIDLFPPESQFLDFQMQLDLRVSRRFDLAGVQVNPVIDLYNIFNAGTVIGQVGTYGPRWQRPSAIMRPRFLRLGLEMDW